MRSHLTRNVFRKLVANEGFIFRCPHQSAIYRNRAVVIVLQRQPQCRSIFGFGGKSNAKPRSSGTTPGHAVMMQMAMSEKIKARPPPIEDLVKAWVTFFTYMSETRDPVNKHQARAALLTFQHIALQEKDSSEPRLSLADLRTAMKALLTAPQDELDMHSTLARVLYSEIQARTQKSLSDESHVDLRHLVSVLSATGESLEARDYAEKYWEQGTEVLAQKNKLKTGRKLWMLSLSGFAREGNERELLKTAEIALNSGMHYTHVFHEIMTSFYASRDDVKNTKKWYSKSLDNTLVKPLPETLSEILKFSLRTGELEWCKSVFREILESNPPKRTWDVVFQWAAGALGKKVEDVEHMMDVMIRRNPTDESIRPDSETLNGLVGLAMSRDDPYLAERYIALGLKKGIQPNAQTYILQMDYRISADDLAGAQIAYDQLLSEEIEKGEDTPVINRYIRALCASGSNTYDRVIAVTEEVQERGEKLEADTVSSLCLMYLKREDINEVIDTLKSYSANFTVEERSRIRHAFVSYCLDPTNNASKAWDSYSIFRRVFDETPVSIRVQVMDNFFSRGRADMGIYVFGHMRQHLRSEIRPTIDTYVACLEGIARCADSDSLSVVHNMLKMDVNIEPITRLYNALMLAYAACKNGDRALNFWEDITNSREGPSYNSLEIVFYACSQKPFGDEVARQIWTQMRKMDIEVTPRVFTAYIGAISSQGKLDEAIELIDGMEKDVGFGLDMKTIGTLYNSVPGQNRKDIVETWAQRLHPTLWAELETLGKEDYESEWQGIVSKLKLPWDIEA